MTKVCAFKTFGLAAWLLVTPVLLTNAEDRPYLTTETPITLLSANDGGERLAKVRWASAAHSKATRSR
jgi:hypothetical protein